MSLIRKAIGTLVIIAGLYATITIFQESPLAGVLFGVLALVVALPLFFRSRKNRANRKTNIGEEPISKQDVGIRQARATMQREDGEFRGVPSGRN